MKILTLDAIDDGIFFKFKIAYQFAFLIDFMQGFKGLLPKFDLKDLQFKSKNLILCYHHVF